MPPHQRVRSVNSDGEQVAERAPSGVESDRTAIERLDGSRVTAEDFEERVLKADHPAMVYFWARWCEPCLRMAPVVVSLARAYEGRLLLASVDTDQDEDLARQQSVAGLPTTVLYLKGEAVNRFVGVVDEGLSDAIDAALGDA